MIRAEVGRAGMIFRTTSPPENQIIGAAGPAAGIFIFVKTDWFITVLNSAVSPEFLY